MKVYALTFEPEGQAYERLLLMCGDLATMAGLVQGSSVREPSGREFLSAARHLLIRDERILNYPGVIGRFPVRRLVFEYNQDLIDIIRSVSSGLYDWDGIRLFEDLHLMRRDESAVLASISAEEHAVLCLQEEESDWWLSQWPGSICVQEESS